MMQLDMPIDRVPDAITAKSVKCGHCFRRNDKVLMRVKPTGFLLNSSMINDLINANKIFVVDVFTGTLFVIQGSDLVVECKVAARVL